MDKRFHVENGTLLEYRGEPKVFQIYHKNGDLVSQIKSYYKENVRKITVPGEIRKIGFMAFHDMPHLEEIVLSKGINAIELGAFWKCGNLTIHFPHSLRRVSPDAFPIGKKTTIHVTYVAGLWPALKKAKWVLSRVPTYRQHSGVLVAMALAYKHTDIKLVLHVKGDIGNREFEGFPVNAEVILKEDIHAKRAFLCSAITDIVIDSNVQFLDSDCFSGGAECYEDTSIESFRVHPENEHFYAREGVLFDKQTNQLVRFPQMKLLENNTYYVPEGTTGICNGAFSWAYGIEHIYLPSKCTMDYNSLSNIPHLDSVRREKDQVNEDDKGE